MFGTLTMWRAWSQPFPFLYLSFLIPEDLSGIPQRPFPGNEVLFTRNPFARNPFHKHFLRGILPTTCVCSELRCGRYFPHWNEKKVEPFHTCNLLGGSNLGPIYKLFPLYFGGVYYCYREKQGNTMVSRGYTQVILKWSRLAGPNGIHYLGGVYHWGGGYTIWGSGITKDLQRIY